MYQFSKFYQLIQKKAQSLRGGTTRQSPQFPMVSNKTPLLRSVTKLTTTWYHGSVMRLPRRGAPRNDGVFNMNNDQFGQKP